MRAGPADGLEKRAGPAERFAEEAGPAKKLCGSLMEVGPAEEAGQGNPGALGGRRGAQTKRVAHHRYSTTSHPHSTSAAIPSPPPRPQCSYPA